jgi:hypothetical protein
MLRSVIAKVELGFSIKKTDKIIEILSVYSSIMDDEMTREKLKYCACCPFYSKL